MPRYTSSDGEEFVLNRSAKIGLGCGILFLVAALFMFIILPGTPFFGYWPTTVQATEVGVLLRNGQFVEVLAPGLYTNPFDFGADIRNINVSGVSTMLQIPEVALAGGEGDGIDQIIGVTVSGVVFRNGLLSSVGVTSGEGFAAARNLWSQWASIYVSDEALLTQMYNAILQSTRVCVGSRELATTAAGNSRNDLANCVEGEWNRIVEPLGIVVTTVNIVDIELPQEIRDSISQISKANQDAQLAVANATLAFNQGLEREAQVQAEIRVTAASQNEQFAAQATSASIQQTAISAERGVIDARATNDALGLLYEQAQAEIQVQISALKAQSETAREAVIADLYQKYPEYASTIIYLAYAEGLKAVEKVFYIPAGTETISLINGGLVNQNGQSIPVIVKPNGILTPVAP